jgi:pseudouridine synthase
MPMALMRVQKWLSDSGQCSRRQGERLIRAGRVSVNGRIVTVLGTKIDPETDRVEVNGRPISGSEEKIYIALNKPRGFVSSCRHGNENLVIDLVDVPQRIFPVGRLDKESTGLLLLTNDGSLHHCLSHPSFDHEKEYEVTVDGHISDNALKYMAKGMPLKGVRTREAQVSRVSDIKFRIILKEGRNRQIRRMVRKVGHQVIELNRIRIANVFLGDLATGAWRYLAPVEKKKLLLFCMECNSGN